MAHLGRVVHALSSASSTCRLQPAHLRRPLRLFTEAPLREHRLPPATASCAKGRTYAASGVFSSLFGWGKSKLEGKNDRTLSWARSARPGCELAPAHAPPGLEIATFAGGCFWGLELAYQRVPGVVNTSVGYTAGEDPAPTYESVCSGYTGHAEAVQVYYDPKETSYEKLLDTFFEHVDPTTLNRQGNDTGTQYRSGIYYHTSEQEAAAKKAIEEVNRKLASGQFRSVRGRQVVSEVQPASDYYLAEKYHQQYLSKGGRFNSPQSAEKGAKEPIRCYG